MEQNVKNNEARGYWETGGGVNLHEIGLIRKDLVNCCKEKPHYGIRGSRTVVPVVDQTIYGQCTVHNAQIYFHKFVLLKVLYMMEIFCNWYKDL